MINKGQIASEPRASLDQPLHGDLMQHHSYLNALPLVFQAHDAEDCLVERPARLDYVVMHMVHRGVDRDSRTKAWVLQRRPSLAHLPLRKGSAISEDMDFAHREGVAHLPEERDEPLPIKQRLAAGKTD